MSSLDVADLADYRFALKTMPDERLVLELVTAHHMHMKDCGDAVANLDRYNAAKAEVLARMNYEFQRGAKK